MLRNTLLSKLAAPLIELSSESRFWTLYNSMLIDHLHGYIEGFDNHSGRLCLILKKAQHISLWQAIIAQHQIDLSDINQDNVLDLLHMFPLSSKKTYNSGFPDKVTAPEQRDNWQFLSSAGTNDRMTVVTDFEKRDYLRASEHLTIKLSQGQPFGLSTIDIPPSACNVVCGLADDGPEPLIDYLLWSAKRRQLFSKSNISDIRGRVERQVFLKRETLLPINPGPWEQICEQLDKYLDKIVADKIKVVRGFPYFLFWLAKRARERGVTFPSVRVILPYGGLAGESLVSFICKVFDAGFVNVYGTGEVGSIGISAVGAHEINVYKELIHLEVTDDTGAPVEPGQPGNVVVTDLTNMAMPIIRYSLGDIGVLKPLPDNPEASQLLLLGRKVECIKLDSGNVVYARDIQNLFFSNEHVLNFKIERVTAKMFKVQVVLDSDIDPTHLEQALKEMFELNTLPKLKVVSFITPESSGKYIAIKDTYGQRKTTFN